MNLDFILDWDRRADADKARAEGRSVCKCGWGCDDPELDICCDCADKIFMAQMLRGEYGREERIEAQASVRAGQ